MKNTIAITSLIFLLFLSLAVQAQQVQSRWSSTVADGVNWQMVTSLGNYVVGTSRGLAGINPETGEILWNNTSFGAVGQERVKQVGSSALIAINLESAIYAIDPFSGTIKFDSREAGIAEVKDQKILYQANGILVSGRDMAGKDILLMTSLDNGKVAWKIEDDFGRLITASEISAKELLIVTL
ncbi:MAG: hypothetical protein RIB47_06690 [Cyclobacteriaceae bacterium]